MSHKVGVILLIVVLVLAITAAPTAAAATQANLLPLNVHSSITFPVSGASASPIAIACGGCTGGGGGPG